MSRIKELMDCVKEGKGIAKTPKRQKFMKRTDLREVFRANVL
jgi:hypothetical protein